MSKVSDRLGNYASYSYTVSSGQFYPAKIKYTANDTAGLSLVGGSTITFSYQARNDVANDFVAGFEARYTQRLSKIETGAREYRLNYAPDGRTGRSRLAAIQECSGATCLNATQLTWQEADQTGGLFAAQSVVATNQADSAGWNAGLRYFTMDVNGDGRTDLVSRAGDGTLTTFLSNGSAWVAAANTPTGQSDAAGWNSGLRYFPADINGDGKGDLIARASDGTLISLISNGSTFASAGSTVTGQSDAAGWNAGLRYFAMDVNGDGRSDIVMRDGAGNFSTYLSNGATFAFAGTSALGLSDANGWNSGLRFFPGEVNGDGRTDLIARDAAGVLYTYLSNGATFSLVGSTPTNVGDANRANHVFPMDVNGDGKLDFVTRGSDGTLSVFLGNGRGLVLQSGANANAGLGDVSGWGNGIRFFTMDIDADGKVDFLYRSNAGDIRSMRSTGSALNFGPSAFSLSYPDSAGWNQGFRFFVADINGDGKADMVTRDLSGNLQALLATGPMPDLLLSITDGLGATTSMNYKPVTDSTVYAPDAPSGYPFLNLSGAVYVVSSTASSNGIGGTYSIRYTYAGGKSHLTSGASLGFRQMVAWDDQQSLYALTEYRQDWPRHGLPTLSYRATYGTNIVLDRQDNTWSFQTPYTGVMLPYLSAGTTKRYESNGTLIAQTGISNTVDAYGNVTASSSTTGDSYSTTTSAVVSNDAVNWIIGKPTSISVTRTLPNGQSLTRAASFTYNPANGLLTRSVVAPSTTLALTTDYGYDAFGNVTSETVSGADILTRSVSVAFESRRRFPTSVTNALGQATTLTFDANFGTLTKLTDPNGIATSWGYDNLGRLIKETRPDASYTDIYYFSSSLCPTASPYAVRRQSLPAVSADDTVCYDVVGRPIRATATGLGGSATYYIDRGYDAIGRLANISRPFASTVSPTAFTSYAYDVRGRVKRITGPDGGITQIAYSGLTSTTTNPKGQASTQVSNSLGWLVRSGDAASAAMTYSYDPFGNLVQVTDPLLKTVTMSYDLLGRRKTMSDPDLGAWSWSYNALGELVSQIDAKSQTTSFEYDKLGRATRRVEPGLISTWAYDTALKGIGQIAQLTSDNGFSQTLTYDNIGRTSRVATVVDGIALNIDYAYDFAGRLGKITYPSGFVQQFTYDNPTGLVSQIQDATIAPASLWEAKAINADFAVTSEKLGNGSTTSRTFNALTGRLEGIGAVSGTGATLQQQGFSYDVIGNVSARTNATQSLSETFGYDSLNRLTSATAAGLTKTYTFDSTGNLSAKSDTGTFAYAGTRPHAVTSVTGALPASYTYDANGNMLTGAGRTLTWTAANLLNSVTQAGKTLTFTYGPDRARFKQTGPSGTTLSIGGGSSPNYERHTYASGLVEHRHYLYGLSGLVGVQLTRSDGTKETRYFHSDALGSITAVSSGSGTVLERFGYDAYGKRRLPSGADGAVTATSTRRGYTGHEHLDEVGLIHMNGRIYDPQIGRFLSPDPMVSDPASTQGVQPLCVCKQQPSAVCRPKRV